MLLAKAAASKPTPALRDDASLSSACFAANHGSSSWFSKVPSRNPDAASGGYRNINVRNLQSPALSLAELAVFTLSTNTEGHHQLVFLPLHYRGVEKNQLFFSVPSLNPPAPEEGPASSTPGISLCWGHSAGKKCGRKGSGNLHNN